MTVQEEQWGSLVQRAEKIERTARLRAAIYSLIPVILAALLLWFTGWQIQQADQRLGAIQSELRTTQSLLESAKDELAQAQQQITRTQQERLTILNQLNSTKQELLTTQDQLTKAKEEADVARKEADDLRKQLDELKKSLESATEQLRLAALFADRRYSGNPWLYGKGIASRSPQQFRLLQSISLLVDAPWKYGGFSPEEGFDSPSFAAYILQTNGVISITTPSMRYQLQKMLPVRNGDPQDGDVVFYPLGYTMFYFKDAFGWPFVVGMTPFGVAALEADFAPVAGYGVVYP